MSNELVIYTDGSCCPNPGRGGWAFIALLPEGSVSEKTNLNQQLPEYEIHVNGKSDKTTNNIMELTAVIEAIKEFPDQTQFKIYSDSQYVINCATGKWKRNKNIELWNDYDKCAKNKKITFIWVRGHNGDKYNEMVDKLAKNN